MLGVLPLGVWHLTLGFKRAEPFTCVTFYALWQWRVIRECHTPVVSLMQCGIGLEIVHVGIDIVPHLSLV